MNTRILFVGCSHTNGYCFKNNEAWSWLDHNYAEIFCKKYNHAAVIYAGACAGNYAYLDWIKSTLNNYDISEIFMQSTYWHRYTIGVCRNVDHGFNYEPGYLSKFEVEFSDDQIHKYTDLMIKDDFAEIKMQPNSSVYEKFDGYKLSLTDWELNREIVTKPFEYTKFWYDLVSHLQYKTYCKDLSLINELCKEKDILFYVWRINERSAMPDNINMYTDLSNIVYVTKSAESWIKEKYDIDISDERYLIDTEHYKKEIHNIIGEEFIPYLKSFPPGVYIDE